MIKSFEWWFRWTTIFLPCSLLLLAYWGKVELVGSVREGDGKYGGMHRQAMEEEVMSWKIRFYVSWMKTELLRKVATITKKMVT